MPSIAQGCYPSDLTERQWQLIMNQIPRQNPGGRPRTTDLRLVINAILYVARTGCAWRYLPKEFPPWPTVYGYFSRWQKLGVWQRTLNYLEEIARFKEGRSFFPSTTIIDAQSVRAPWGECRGWDGFKKVRGRKRQILVDTLGFIWSSSVHEANRSENNKAILTIKHWPHGVSHPKRVLGDSSYGKAPFDGLLFGLWGIWPETRRGTQEWTKRTTGWGEKVAKVATTNLKPQRWRVERSFAWFNYFRRLSKDYEKKTIYSEAFIYISALVLVLERLVR